MTQLSNLSHEEPAPVEGGHHTGFWHVGWTGQCFTLPGRYFRAVRRCYWRYGWHF
jgi:hypothetical protein